MSTKNILITGYTSKIFDELFEVYLKQKDLNFYFIGRSKPLYPYNNWIEFDFVNNSFLKPILNEALLPDKFDYVFLNHGILCGKKIGDYTDSDILDTISINLTSYIIIINTLYSKFLSNSSIVLTSSISAKNGSYDDLYASTKKGIEGLVNSMGKKLQHSRINCISPGIISDAKMTQVRADTQIIDAKKALTPLKKLATSRNIASSINFLLFEESSHITGQILHINGGL